ncbi:MAG: tRNA (N(6)-L-threonylcarbamoyladenosine(37)-C(2))-methylthiotransferase MtaB [Lachnospiraceae bacterium]|nr:tRNA (N(6)-L-threonylcarbamoyladenosine(37)-C(2))-methylthiotransferase MtaB [Lachnospiraceae bacterium]
MKKCAFHNLGCKVNAYETEAMREQLSLLGYEIVSFEETADVYVINTCSVTNIADRKSRQMLHRARKRNPEALVVAAGCYAQAFAEELKKDGTADVILGNGQKSRLAAVLTEWEEKRARIACVSDVLHEKEYEELRVSCNAGHTRAFIKIQDGCNQFCSYCLIPYTRGRIRSRGPEDILREVTDLAEKGCREVVLTGILLSAYGTERAELPGLLDVVRQLDSVPGIERIRLGSLEPRVITEEFVDGLAGLAHFCPHFHLSLQSGCDATLKRMNRHYTTREYLDKLKQIRAAFAHPAVTTDVIVGFPGETEAEFAETEAFVEEADFFEMHVFPYSKRKGTPAERMSGQLAEAVKKARSAKLLEKEREMSRRFRAYYIGKEVELLSEEEVSIKGERFLLGHSREYVKILWPGEAEKINEIARVLVTGTFDEDKMLAE